MVYKREEFCNNCTNKLITDNKSKYALLIVEIYRFRTLREYIGHLETTKLLLQIEKTIPGLIEGFCISAHFDDDKFAVFMSYETINEVYQVTEELLNDIKNYKLPCTILPAAGICTTEGNADRIETLIENAKLAMDTVKGRFARNYAIYDSNIRKQMLLSRRIESRAQIALDTNEFEPYYMPVCNLQKDQIIGIEALARWISKTDGMIYPEEFIPIFEKNGLIIDLDFKIYEAAFKAVSEWTQEGYKVPDIKINISSVHFYEKDFLDRLLKLTHKYEIPVNSVIADIICTNNYMQETDVTKLIIDLGKAGFKISLDDFGSVGASINILTKYKLDMVSLDSSITSNINKSENGNIIISGIMDIFKKCKISVIAEGIETEEQAEVLKKAGCNYGQGYLYYKPMSKDDMKKHLQK